MGHTEEQERLAGIKRRKAKAAKLTAAVDRIIAQKEAEIKTQQAIAAANP